MSDRDGKIWMDGQLVEWRDAKIHVLTHTLHYGCGAFEGVRAYETGKGTAIFRLQDHTKRLFNSAKNLMVAAWAWGAYLGEEGMQRGIRTKISSYTRHHVNITMSQAKAVSNYTNSILANTEALDDGYDEAILLDASGFVSEGSGENIFVIKDGAVYTPDLSAGALNGITRDTVLHICKDLGLEVVQKRITRDELYISDELFFTGTAAEVTPIREVDRVQIGEGRRGPITKKIQTAYFDIVNGRNPKYAHWLTLV
jgi:branched-chain amino acid aminotransferase